jgi:hypothetical protein
VLTHDALPAATRKAYLTSDLKIIHDPMEAYGWSDQRPARFQPSARDVTNWLPVYGWLCWLKEQNNGKRDFRIIVQRCRNKSWWAIADRTGRSEKQTKRWFDGAIAAIYGKYQNEVWTFTIGKN